MSYHSEQKTLSRKHLDGHLSALRGLGNEARPPKGWVRAIRDALGMTTGQLARRLGVSQPRIIKLEKAEVDGSLTLDSLKSAAQALNCTLVYALIPNEPLDDMVRHQAERVAQNQLKWTNHTMRLENQALDKADLESQRDRLVQKLMNTNLRKLWDKE